MGPKLPTYKFTYRALAHSAALLLALPAVAAADPGDIIVQREPGLSRAEHAQINADAGVAPVESLPIARTEVVTPAPGEQAEALATLNADDDVVYAEPDRPVRALTNDSFWTSLWGLFNDGSGARRARTSRCRRRGP
jgi:hypothetical protein